MLIDRGRRFVLSVGDLQSEAVAGPGALRPGNRPAWRVGQQQRRRPALQRREPQVDTRLGHHACEAAAGAD